jgi:hypothetical protein
MVLDTETGKMSMWAIPDSTPGGAKYLHGVVDAHKSDNKTLLCVTGGEKLYKIDKLATTDDGAAISSLYRLPYSDLGSPGREKVIRETLLYGIGTVDVKQNRIGGAQDTATSVAMGTSPTIKEARRRVAAVGDNISTQVSASSGAWTLNRLVYNVAAVAPPGVRRTV